MEIFNKSGSKERLFEMIGNVNKVVINEELNLSPENPNNNIVSTVIEQIKGDIIKITNSDSMKKGSETFVELIGKDDKNNIVKMNLAVAQEQGEQDGVFAINGVELREFNYQKSDGSETIVLDENGLRNANQEHQADLIEIATRYVSLDSEGAEEITDEMYEDAIRWIDKVPYEKGTEDMQTSKAYGDEKPTNTDVRVHSPELDQFVNERSADPIDTESLSGEELLKAKIGLLTADLEFNKLAQAYENFLKIKKINFEPSDVIQTALSAARDLIAEYLQQAKGMDVSGEDVQNFFQGMLTQKRPVVAEEQEVVLKRDAILKAFNALQQEMGGQLPSREEVKHRAQVIQREWQLAATQVNEEEKSDYPDPIGKKFKPKSNYPKKKKKINKAVNIGESTDRDQYEDVVFMQGEDADEALDILKNQGEDAAMQHLMQWHQPGSHMGNAELGHGSSDRTYEKDGYIMSWNFPLNYIGLQYDLSQMNEVDKEEVDVEIGTEPEAPDVVNFDAEMPDTGQAPDFKDMPEPSMGSMEEIPADDIEQVMQDKEEAGDMIPGGLADDKTPQEFCPYQLAKGLKVEMEHTDDPLIALEITMDHLVENPKYYGDDDEDPEAMAQQGAQADAEADDEVADELLGFTPHNIGDIPDVPEDEEDKEETDELLGFKPHNIGDYANEEFDNQGQENETTLSALNVGDSFSFTLEPEDVDYYSGGFDDEAARQDAINALINKIYTLTDKTDSKYYYVSDDGKYESDRDRIVIKRESEIVEVQIVDDEVDDSGLEEYTGNVGDKYQDAEGNDFTVTNKTKGGVGLRGAAGDKEIATRDLQFMKKLSESKESKIVITEELIKTARQALNNRGVGDGMTKKEAVQILIKHNIK